VAKRQRVRVQAPVQDENPAPVVVNAPPVVGAPLVAEVVNAPVVVQHVAVVGQVETPMEVKDEDALLQRLFFKKYGRALPETETEKEKEKENEVDQIKFVIDLTDESDEMEVATPVVVVKTEPIEIATNVNVTNVNNFAEAKSVYNESGIRVSRRLELIELAKARKAITEFGKSLRKSDVIQEKEAPLAAGNVIADNDTDMAEDVSSNPVGSVNPVESGNNVNAVESVTSVEPLTTAEAIEMAEAAIAESDAAIAANQKEIDKFFN
jgi:hypothetical protein